LCAELAVDLEEWMVATDHHPPSSVELLNRAHAILAEQAGGAQYWEAK
jgi:hypothetical protein